MDENTIALNKTLCDRYPFLKPDTNTFDYTYTLLEDMPDGWLKSFGFAMCEDIRNELLETGGEEYLYDYKILQIKEKYGELRWYDNYDLKAVSKYEELSRHTCIKCGAPATKISTGWICPWCDKCASLLKNTTFRDASDWFKAEDEE